MRQYKLSILIVSLLAVSMPACKKFLDIKPPITSLTTVEVFSTNQQAEWAIAGVYSKMINGMEQSFGDIAMENFGAGLSTISAGFSADELKIPNLVGDNAELYLMSNKLTLEKPGFNNQLWRSAFKVIYDANAVIEGIAASTSPELTTDARNQISGEALALRAFSYFYLVNFFGDLPLVLTTDFNQTAGLSRSPASRIYQQIITDLKAASGLLSADYSMAADERIRINKWFAEAMLARVYLYTGDQQQAIVAATNVIDQNNLYSIVPQLSGVFLKNSQETILQLKQTNQGSFNNATPEGFIIGPADGSIGISYTLSEDLVAAFEPGDKRMDEWTEEQNGKYAPAKYKISRINSSYGGELTEYYMVMRLAEMYLVRAEARLQLSDANKNAAIDDLNQLRGRANINLLNYSLTADQVKAAIEQERRVELFLEWGHRWFDLKRTNRAKDILPSISYKQPWAGDYQFLYPIPVGEIANNANLQQNPLYNR